jgi:HEXXH motif-containing protein
MRNDQSQLHRLPATLDWSRLAEPQEDGYDTEVVVGLAAMPTPADVPTPLAAASGDHTARPWFAVAPVYADRPDFRRDFSRFRVADPQHPNLARAVALVDCWPAGAAQARRLISVLHAALDPDVDDDLGWATIATSSHSYDDAFGTLWATVHSPLGLAEAIVHEMAHHKLRAYGVRFESADRIATNAPSERYPSALLGGRMRPMPAVLHAQYALLHMVALKLAVLAAGPAVAAGLARALLRRDLQMVGEGAVTIGRNLVVDRHGARFMPALWRWQAQLITEATAST